MAQKIVLDDQVYKSPTVAVDPPFVQKDVTASQETTTTEKTTTTTDTKTVVDNDGSLALYLLKKYWYVPVVIYLYYKILRK